MVPVANGLTCCIQVDGYPLLRVARIIHVLFRHLFDSSPSGSCRGLPGAPVEDLPEPFLRSSAAAGCRRLHRQPPGPGQLPAHSVSTRHLFVNN